MKKCKKNLSVLLLACSFVACSATALACQDFTKASANTESMKVTELTTYTMKDGASVKISEDGKNGLRFTAKMSTEEYGKIMAYGYESLHFGVAVAPASYHAENPLNWDTMFSEENAVYDWAVDGEYTDVGKTRIINQASTEMVAEKDAKGELTGNMLMSASVTDVRDGTVTANNPNGVNNIAKKFVGVGYIRYVDPELGVKFIFTNEKDASGTDSVMSSTRSIAQVAERAVAGTAFDDTTKETIAQDYLSVDNLFAQFEQGSTYIWNYSAERADFKTSAEVLASATADSHSSSNVSDAKLERTGKILHFSTTADRPAVQFLPVYSKEYYTELLTAYPDAVIYFEVMVKTTDIEKDISLHVLGHSYYTEGRYWQWKNEWNTVGIKLSDYVAKYDTITNTYITNNETDSPKRDLFSIERNNMTVDANKRIDVYCTEPKLLLQAEISEKGAVTSTSFDDNLLNIDEGKLFNSTATMKGGNYKFVLTDKDTGVSQELLNTESLTADKLNGLSDSYEVSLVNVAKNGTVGSTIFSTSYLAFSESAILSGNIVDYSSSDFQTKWASEYTKYWDNTNAKVTDKVLGNQWTATENVVATGTFAYFESSSNTSAGGNHLCFIPVDIPVELLNYFAEQDYQISFDVYVNISNWGAGGAIATRVPKYENDAFTYTTYAQDSDIAVKQKAWTTLNIDILSYVKIWESYQTNGLSTSKYAYIFMRPYKELASNQAKTGFSFTELRLTKVN